MPPSSLDTLFSPRSIAVVGASRHSGTIGAEVFANLLRSGFPGPIYPVNPGATAVQSVRAYPSMDDVPEPVDLAVIVVPAERVGEVVQQCGKRGVRGVVVLSAGFAEMGAAGAERQAALVAYVREHGIRLVGPNCLGLLSTDPRCPINATFAPTTPPAGRVAISTQSGALGLALLDYARELGIGIRQFVSIGNKADVSTNDLLERWEDDPEVATVVLYVESFGNPRRFMEIARRVSRHKPIIAVKSGRTEAGARAAASHTGALAGLDVATGALLDQAGVIRTDTIEELFDVAMLVGNQPIPRGNRVAILTNAGGPGIIAADACSSRGLRVAPLAAATVEGLRAFLPPGASVVDPVDLLASASARDYWRALHLLLDDENVDAVLVIFVPPIVTDASQVAASIRDAAAANRKPVLSCFLGTHGIPAAVSSLREGHFPSFRFPEEAAAALARVVRYGAWLRRPEGTVPAFAGIDPVTARAPLHAPAGEGWLDAPSVRDLLGAYGVPMAELSFARDATSAAAAADRLGYPVAVKLASRSIQHKSDVGGVHLALSSATEVRRAFAAIARSLGEAGREAEMDGVLVQQMAPAGVETFLGMTRQPGYGPLVAFGIGGRDVELWNDVSFRLSPITDRDAVEMMSGLRGARLLDGYRGAPPADRGALVDILLRLDRLVTDHPEIVEIDINPLVARAPGLGAIAVDARVRTVPTT